MLRTSWTPGPEAGDGEVLIAVTAFRADHGRDLPGIARAGLQLRRAWPEMPGAVGMWLWARPLERRCGSVSVWRDERSLYGFVGRPDHVRIMRQYRQRGRLSSASWTTAWADPSALWREAFAV